MSGNGEHLPGVEYNRDGDPVCCNCGAGIEDELEAARARGRADAQAEHDAELDAARDLGAKVARLTEFVSTHPHFRGRAGHSSIDTAIEFMRAALGSQAEHEQQVREAVLRELNRARSKFPEWPTDPLHALAVLGEEFGELTQAVLQATYEGGSRRHVETEAIQTAAMALRFVDSLAAYEYTRGPQHQQIRARSTAQQPAATEGE